MTAEIGFFKTHSSMALKNFFQNSDLIKYFLPYLNTEARARLSEVSRDMNKVVAILPPEIILHFAKAELNPIVTTPLMTQLRQAVATFNQYPCIRTSLYQRMLVMPEDELYLLPDRPFREFSAVSGVPYKSIAPFSVKDFCKLMLKCLPPFLVLLMGVHCSHEKDAISRVLGMVMVTIMVMAFASCVANTNRHLLDISQNQEHEQFQENKQFIKKAKDFLAAQFLEAISAESPALRVDATRKEINQLLKRGDFIHNTMPCLYMKTYKEDKKAYEEAQKAYESAREFPSMLKLFTWYKNYVDQNISGENTSVCTIS